MTMGEQITEVRQVLLSTSVISATLCFPDRYFYGSGRHSCFYFRSLDKTELLRNALITEVRQVLLFASVISATRYFSVCRIYGSTASFALCFRNFLNPPKKRRSHVRHTLPLRNPHRKPRGHHPPRVAHSERSRLDCCRGHPHQRPSPPAFRHSYPHDKLPQVQ